MLKDLSYLISIIKAYIASYNVLLAKANTLKNGSGIRKAIFVTKNKLIGIVSRLKACNPNRAVYVPCDLTVSNIIKTFGKA